MIRRGNRAVCATASRGCRCGRSASTFVPSLRTKARERQTGHSSHHSRVFRRTRKTLLSSLLVYVTVSLAFCFAAQRAFMSADSFFFAAALIGRRTAVFLGVALACFGEDLPFPFADRCFMASA